MYSIRALGGAVLCTVSLSLFGTLGPPGAGLLLVAAPLPSLVLGGRFGQTSCTYCALAAGAAILAIAGPVHSALYFACVGLPAILATHALQRGFRIETVMTAAVGAFLASGTIVLWGAAGDFSSWYTAMLDGWRQSFDQSLALYAEIGVSEETLGELEANRDALGRALLEVFPALAAVACGAIWLVNIRLASRWASWPQARGWRTWQAPPWLIWMLIVSGFAMFVPAQGPSILARNVFGVTLACYFCQGLAIVSYYLQRFGLPRGLRIASYLLIAVQQIVAGLVLALGIFDFWGDFRRLEPRPADASIGSDSD